jgi:cytochrome c556
MTLRSAERRIIAALLLLLAAGTGFALAHEGAKGVVKERMDLMKGQAKQMKLIGDMAKGKKKFDAAKAAAAAHDLGLTTKKIPELFPEGSNGHPSEALDAVWKEWDRFKGDAQDAEAAANALAAALEASGEDWKPSFQKMTDACKSCHETFRAKEEEGKEGHHH